MPYDICTVRPEPVYKEIEGWNEDLTGIRSPSEVPAKLGNYVRFLESELGVPVKYLSVGPDRVQTLIMN